jgi:hypothetical protein
MLVLAIRVDRDHLITCDEKLRLLLKISELACHTAQAGTQVSISFDRFLPAL